MIAGWTDGAMDKAYEDEGIWVQWSTVRLMFKRERWPGTSVEMVERLTTQTMGSRVTTRDRQS